MTTRKMQQDPILVTGVAGFIGFHTAARLLERGERVIGLDNVNDYYDVRLKKARLAKLKPFKQFTFTKTEMLKGTGQLYVNGKKVAEGAIDKTVGGAFSLSETFDVGVDNGTPVSNNYKAKDHFPFTGQIDKVVITLTGEDADMPKEQVNPGVD